MFNNARLTDAVRYLSGHSNITVEPIFTPSSKIDGGRSTQGPYENLEGMLLLEYKKPGTITPEMFQEMLDGMLKFSPKLTEQDSSNMIETAANSVAAILAEPYKKEHWEEAGLAENWVKSNFLSLEICSSR